MGTSHSKFDISCLKFDVFHIRNCVRRIAIEIRHASHSKIDVSRSKFEPECFSIIFVNFLNFLKFLKIYQPGFYKILVHSLYKFSPKPVLNFSKIFKKSLTENFSNFVEMSV